MKTSKFMFFVLVLVVVSSSPLYSIVYGSVSGIVTDEDGKRVSGVQVSIYGHRNSRVITDKDGKYQFKSLIPETYSISFLPPLPYCNIGFDNLSVEPGKNVIFNKSVKVGGTIRGRVIFNNSTKPFPEVSVRAWGRMAGAAREKINEDGTYSLGGNNGQLCPSAKYYIEARCEVPNVAYKILLGVVVEKRIETKVEDIVFDLNDPTGIDGCITSSIDEKVLSGIQISIFSMDKTIPGDSENMKFGEVYTNNDGYYYIKNLDPGNYWIYVLPDMEDEISIEEYEKLCKEVTNIVVIKGEKKRVDAKLDIRASQMGKRGRCVGMLECLTALRCVSVCRMLCGYY